MTYDLSFYVRHYTYGKPIYTGSIGLPARGERKSCT